MSKEDLIDAVMNIFIDVYNDPKLKCLIENGYLFKGYNAN